MNLSAKGEGAGESLISAAAQNAESGELSVPKYHVALWQRCGEKQISAESVDQLANNEEKLSA